jgi:ATP-binding cassette, subfamily B, bacterial
MRLLIPYLMRYRRAIALALGLSAIGQLCAIVDPLVVRYAIDTYAAHTRAYSTEEFVHGIGWVLALGLLVAVAAQIADRTREYFVNVVVQSVGADLFADGMERSINLCYPLMEDQESGRTMGILQTTRMDVQRFIAVSINVVFTCLVGLLFLCVFAYRAHWLFAPALLLLLPLIGVINASLGRNIKTLQKAIVAQTGALAGAATEMLRNVDTVKSLGAAGDATARLREMTTGVLDLELRKARLVRLVGALRGGGVTLLRMGLLFLMLYLLYARTITLGEFFALALYAGFVFTPLRELGSAAGVFREADASLARLASIFAAPQDSPAPAGLSLSALAIAQPARIAFQNVGFQHRSAATPALSSVTFELVRGETVAFVGPSGAGKSTIVRLLLGLYQPLSGEISYDGVPAALADLEALRRSAGVIGQETQLFSGSIRDNLRVARRDASDADCIEALTHAGGEHLLLRSESGLSAVIGEGGLKLSGGERQRIAIARALVRKPAMLLIDEATASLDSVSEAEISRTIRDVTRQSGAICVIIAHRLATVMYADRICVLDHGRIVQTGTHSQLVSRPGIYSAMWRRQVGESMEGMSGEVLAAAPQLLPLVANSPPFAVPH